MPKLRPLFQGLDAIRAQVRSSQLILIFTDFPLTAVGLRYNSEMSAPVISAIGTDTGDALFIIDEALERRIPIIEKKRLRCHVLFFP